jgi:NAD(P)-binding Rossmann-like domain
VFDVDVGALKSDAKTREGINVAVAGAGWYGCHIASALKSQGVEVVVFEKNGDLFSEASGNNQFRLHLGLHYARSAATRHQSRDGYHRFVERYPRLSRPVTDNIYLVPRFESLLDFETYFSIMLASGIAIDRVPLDTMPFLNAAALEGAIRCDERVILTTKAREHFRAKLDGSVRLGEPIEVFSHTASGLVVNGRSFDLLIDATWGALRPARDVYFEPTLLLYYSYRGTGTFPAITLVDGPLASIYPTEWPGMYTLSSVCHTPLARCVSKAEAYSVLARFDSEQVEAKRKLMEDEIRRYVPAFGDLFAFEQPQLAIKTKPHGKSDNRACVVDCQERVISVQSGKIDTIFFATDRILGQVLSTETA